MRTFSYLGEVGAYVRTYARKKTSTATKTKKQQNCNSFESKLLQDLFYRTNYKQMRYMNNLRD